MTISFTRWFRSRALSLLALMPIPSVAFAAESALTAEANSLERSKALNEIAARALGTTGSWTLLDPRIRRLREDVLPPLTVRTTLEQALARFRLRRPELSGAEADLEFEAVVALLRQRGMITVDERALVSHGDSRIYPQE
ncbi:MAG: hypothetical protein IT285_10970 [Bdellovibrionales bacterium]|nr:hypothetical protein [Bdellovibrionales bacterium]